MGTHVKTVGPRKEKEKNNNKNYNRWQWIMVIGEKKKRKNKERAKCLIREIYWCDKIIKINKTCTILNWCVIFTFEGNYETNLKAWLDNIFSYFTLKLKKKNSKIEKEKK